MCWHQNLVQEERTPRSKFVKGKPKYSTRLANQSCHEISKMTPSYQGNGPHWQVRQGRKREDTSNFIDGKDWGPSYHKSSRGKCTVDPLTFGDMSSRSINFQTAFLAPLTFGGVSSRSINFQTVFLGLLILVMCYPGPSTFKLYFLVPKFFN